MRVQAPGTQSDAPRSAGPIPADESGTPRTRAGIAVVGVGASAGGLEAFTQLLKHLPADTGMGFVLVQHLDPHHESALTQLLTRVTLMPVCEATSNLRVEANRVYVIPPNVNMAIAHGTLKLTKRGQNHSPQRSIDFFFESLAQDQRDQAIGIVLSGTATDGTLGLEAVKAEGGITFAQDESAKYDSMPRSAIATGCVDFVLAPEGIAKELVRIARHPFVAGEPLASAKAKKQGAAREGGKTPRTSVAHREANSRGDCFKRILLLLRNHCGVDFSFYKPSTIERRVARRMVLNKKNELHEYADFLKGNTQELDALYSDALISVTGYFRNPEAFETLQGRVFPKLLQQRGQDDPLRVWVLGCSTGQEAYSIAMSFAEFSENIARVPRLQVFATDLNDALLDKARHGLYAKTVMQDVSPARLRRFFVEEQGGYRVSKSLREQVVFARQNLLSDPPFSRMDLISCRNLLIYLEPDLQKRIIPAFHYSLRPGGFLFLGASESIGQFTGLFEPTDKKQKIFSRKAAPTPAFRLPLPEEGTTPSRRRHTPLGKWVEQELPESLAELKAQREADRISVNQFAPPGVLINAEFQVLQFRGPTSPYLEPPTGKASFHVLKMAREGLMLPLRAALNKAKRENKPVRGKHVRVQQNGGSRAVNFQVIPLKNLKERCYRILFEPADVRKAERDVASEPPRKPRERREESHRVTELESELSEARDYLQSIQEQHEAVNEELRASHEEVQSANEELQSINEELETSKEELESANEELTTVNEEMANRNTELSRLNADLTNLQTTIHTAILLFSRDLALRRFTPLAERMFNLLATDVGRSISGIRHNLELPDLEQLLVEVIDTVSVREREVRDKDGRWYALRARPYMLDNKVDGVALMLVDIDVLKRSEQEKRASLDYAQAILRTARDPFIVLRADLVVNTANEAFYKLFKVTPDQTEGLSIFEISNGAWGIPRLRRFLEEIIPRNSFFDDFEVTHEFPTIGRRTMLLNARRLETDERVPHHILLTLEDITGRLESQAAVRDSEIRFRRLFEAAQDGILILDPVSRKITDANPFMLDLLGYTKEDFLGKELWEIGLLKDEEAGHAAFRKLQQKGYVRYEDMPLQAKSGQKREVEVVANLYTEDAHSVIQCNIRDITDRKRAEEALRQSESRYRTLFELGPVAVYSCDAAGVIQEYNSRASELWGREPALGDTDERFCGSFKMFRPDGSFMPHEHCPMADVLCGKVSAVHDGEVVIERPDGSRVIVIVNITPRKNERGEIAGAINCFCDITERKRAEEAMARLAAIVESSDAAIVSKNLDGIIQTWNQAAESLLGYTAEEVIGKPITIVIPKERHEEEADILRRIGQGHGIEPLQTVRHRKDGSLVDISLTVSPIKNAKNEVIGISGIARDITPEKRAMEEREQLLAREKIARDEAEAANNSKDLFLAILSHELRTPLHAVLGWATMLRRRRTEKDLMEGLDIIERNCRAQAQLIADVLDMSGILAGKLHLALSTCDLTTVVQAALDAVRPAAEEKTIRLETILDVSAEPVTCDPGRIQQVVCNLLINAIKFTPEGGTIKVTLAHDPSMARIQVIDTGPGISAEFLARIFDRFRQADQSSKRKRGGLGLGLFIAKQIVERHGGSIVASSAGEGKGATFTVDLPLHAVHVDEETVPPSADATGQSAVSDSVLVRLDGLRVLVVDDEPDARRLIAKALEEAGATVTAAAGVDRALAALPTAHPHVIVSDLAMPDEDGFDLIQHVRAAGYTPEQLPAVALTAFAHKEYADRALLAGFQVHLSKPVDLQNLTAVVSRLARTRESA